MEEVHALHPQQAGDDHRSLPREPQQQALILKTVGPNIKNKNKVALFAC